MKCDDMKRLMIPLFFLVTGCDIEKTLEQNHLTGTWEAVWQIDSETLSGQVVLIDNGTGHINIPKQTSSLLLNQKATADFTWQKNDKNFIFKRLDNNFELNYEILSEDRNEIYMTFADEVYIKLVKQE